MRVRDPVLKWLSLNWSERAALFEALRVVSICTLRLKRGKYALEEDTSEGHGLSQDTNMNPLSPERLARMVEVVGDGVPWEVNCLNRSISLMMMLRRRGMAPCLRLGVKRQEDELQFHAWVELNARVVNDRPNIEDEFKPFGRSLPPRGATVV